MPPNQLHFSSLQALKQHLQERQKGSLLIAYKNCPDYEGMVLSFMLVYDVVKSKYQLDVQWMCLGLDLYGDTLQESYVYHFNSLENFIHHLALAYQIGINDIPISYQFNHALFPNPLKNENKKLLYQKNWERFQADFNQDKFLDKTLEVVYSSRA